MSLEGDIALLSQVPLFRGLNADQMRLLAFSAVPHQLPAGTTLFEAGAPASSGYVVASGRLELTAVGDGGRKRVELCGPAALIGEIALFIETPRPATAVALEDSQVLELGRPLIARMLTEYPLVAVRLKHMLAERLQGTIAELVEVDRRLSGLAFPDRKRQPASA